MRTNNGLNWLAIEGKLCIASFGTDLIPWEEAVWMRDRQSTVTAVVMNH